MILTPVQTQVLVARGRAVAAAKPAVPPRELPAEAQRLPIAQAKKAAKEEHVRKAHPDAKNRATVLEVAPHAIYDYIATGRLVLTVDAAGEAAAHTFECEPFVPPTVALNKDGSPKAPPSLSPSKITTFLACPLKWYHAQVLGLETPSTPATELGTECHTIAETYLREGLEPHDRKAGRIIQAGMHLLEPMRAAMLRSGGRALKIEEWIVLNGLGPCEAVPKGTRMRGRVDTYAKCLADVPEILLPGERERLAAMGATPETTLFVSDHKTTSDLRYAKTPAELDVDVQTHIYAYVIGLMTWKTVPAAIVLEHLQYRTKGLPIAQRTRTIVTWEAIEKTMDKVNSTAAAMLTLAHKPDCVSVVRDPRNARPSACGDYGGCPFAVHCPHSPENRAASAAAHRQPLPILDVHALPGAQTMSTPSKTVIRKPTIVPATPFPVKAAIAAAKVAQLSAADARKAALFKSVASAAVASAGKGAQAPAPVAKTLPLRNPPVRMNPPDAAPANPPIDSKVGVDALQNNLEAVRGPVAIAFAQKIVAGTGCAWDAVIETGGFFIGNDGKVYPPQAPSADPAPYMIEKNEASGDYSAYVLSEDGTQYNVLYGEDNETYAFATEADALAVACWRLGLDESGEATQDTVVSEGEAPNTYAAAYQAVDAYAKADVKKAGAVDAIVAILHANNGVINKKIADSTIKSALGADRLSGKARTEVLDLGIACGAFRYDTDNVTWPQVEDGGGGAPVDPNTPVVVEVVGDEEPGDVSVALAGPETAAVVSDAEMAAMPVLDGVPEPDAYDLAERAEQVASGIVPIAYNPTLVILVDCLALNVGSGDLAAFLATFMDAAAAEGADVFTTGAQYKRGVKIVAAKVQADLEASPLTGWWFLSSGHPCADDVLAVLSRFGAVVVRGVR